MTCAGCGEACDTVCRAPGSPGATTAMVAPRQPHLSFGGRQHDTAASLADQATASAWLLKSCAPQHPD